MIQKQRHQQIFKRDARKAMVSKTIAILKQWRLSPFENEAACRHGLRSSLCMNGHKWQHADHEAGEIVRQALMTIGAKRPTWFEGQWQYTAGRESCVRCGGHIDEIDQNSGFRFCSTVCAAIERERMTENHQTRSNNLYNIAAKTIKLAGKKPRPCDHCEKLFRPASEASRYCCIECATDHIRKEIPTRSCMNCGHEFRPRTLTEDQKFCSRACSDSHGRTGSYDFTCAWCNSSFSSKLPYAASCSPSCASNFARAKNGVLPKKITAPAFDFVFTNPVNFAPRRLSPAVFDRLFEAA